MYLYKLSDLHNTGINIAKPKEYFLCLTCKLAFKDLQGAVEHKINSTHRVGKVDLVKYESFPVFKLEKIELFPAIEHMPEFVSSKPFSIGESTEPYTDGKYYACLTCRLTFRSLWGANEHRINIRHKIVRVNYPLGSSEKEFQRIEEIIGSNIDFDAFYKRVAQQPHGDIS